MYINKALFICLLGMLVFSETGQATIGFGVSPLFSLNTTQTPNLINPNGGETFAIFSSEMIQWAWYDSTITFVSIELNRNYSNGVWEVIADATENDGEYAWSVTGPPSDSCRIRICAIADTFCDMSDGNFSIVSLPAYLAMVPANNYDSTLTALSVTANCPDLVSQLFRFKNIGEGAAVVFAPSPLTGPELTRTHNCPAFFALPAGAVSTYGVTITLHSSPDGIYHDTLRVLSDAANAVNGTVSFPIVGIEAAQPFLDSLWADSISCDTITLQWTMSGNTDFTRIYRDGLLVESVASPIQSYADTSTIPGIFAYSIQAVNECGVSELSDAALSTRIAFPSVPQDLTFADDSCFATIAWNPSFGDVDYYLVYRDSVVVDSVASNDTLYVDYYAPIGIANWYNVSALNLTCGESALSNADSGSVTLSYAVEPPEVVIVIAGDDARIQWDPILVSADNCPTIVSGYIVSFAEVSDGPFWFLRFTSDTTYTHQDVVHWTESMYYRVDGYVGSPNPLLFTQGDNNARITREEVLERLKR